MGKVTLVFLVIALVGCSATVPRGPDITAVPKLELPSANKNATAIRRKLLDQYAEWKGVRYRFGGLDKSGIDCSGFVYTTYKTKWGLDLPRSTDLQSKFGRKVAKNQLRAGDLVFFKTGFLDRHVGLYLGDSTFLHASTSNGVTVSSLTNSYWASKYWLSTRVLP